MSIQLIIYLSVVGAIGLFFFVRTALWLQSSRRRRENRMTKLGNTEPVRTSTPVDNPTKVARERGLRSIEANFTVTRRLLVPFILVMTALLLAIPFLSAVPAALLTVVAGGITVLGGVALRPILENAIAGLMISTTRLANLGDTVCIDDLYGTVEDITATHTTIKLWDWRRYLVPNSVMLQSRFFNYSLFDSYLWSHVEFRVAYDADLDTVRRLALAAPLDSSSYASYEAPRFWVMEMNEHSIVCWIAAWADSPAAGWQLSHDIASQLIIQFQQHGIDAHGYRHLSGPIGAVPPPR
ncbi:MAG TPA: mechanosensitive ion channel family protein [Kofleriaceae bacterium]|nr:mechanosensitive ion channel family protein [Kofleriaceae bacterium]